MTLSPGPKVQPNRSTLRSPAGFNAACSSMLSERAPTPPRFIGQSTWMSRMGLRPNRFGMRVFANSMMRLTEVVRRHEVEVAVGSGRAEIRHQALIDAMGAGDDPAPCGLPEDFGEPYHRHSA